MRHTYRCPMRWADMDMLGHINNVAYVDYLQEARIDMFAAHPEFRGGEDLAEGVVVARHELEFLAPASYRGEYMYVDSWVTDLRAGSFTMAYEIYQGRGTERSIYARGSTVLAPFVFATESPRRITAAERAVLNQYLEPGPARPPLAAAGSSRFSYPLQVRWSDVDAYRHVNNVKYFEYFQEARIAYTLRIREPGEQYAQVVIARSDVDYLRPILFRRTPYQVHTWISHVGNTSFTFAAEIRDGDQVLASSRTVAVAFDTETQRKRDLPEGHRRLLLSEAGLDQA